MGELDGVLTWAEIDLEAIRHNIRAYQRHVGAGVRIIAVVKANAYGHGVVRVAQAALEAGAFMLAVHRLNEGIELRQAGIQAPILLMGYTPPEGAQAVAAWRLTPSLMTAEFARALSAQAGLAGWQAPVHVKIDTGMSRYGLMPDEALDFVRSLTALPNLRLEGMFTHFATADSLDQSWARRQLAVFNQVIGALSAAGIDIPLLHAANSAAAMRLPEAHFHAVRPGIAIYGLDPSSDWPPVFEIKPALTLKSRVARVRELPIGAGVSYGRTFVTERLTTAALVPVGYGDGYHRVLSNKGVVLVGGRRAAVIGRVCMDQFVIDVSGFTGVKQDDEVVLVGRQGEEHLRAEEVAQLAGTINYEVTTSLLPRVVRVYR